ncbi:MAG: hypothetical protein IJ608_11940 [Lachnospiraceae bacterium]|nr:hypothetical protein [Lachnospiraceae bacterium]
MSGRNNRNLNDGALTFIAVMIVAIFAMPLVGGYLLLSGKNKALGGALLVIGIIIWVALGVNS